MIIKNDEILQLAIHGDLSQHLEKKVLKRKGGERFHTQSTTKSGEEHTILQNESEPLSELGFGLTLCEYHSCLSRNEW
jgi:hypothetical protein